MIKYTLDECISFLERNNSPILSDDFRYAIMDAVAYLKGASSKPSLDEPVRRIKYFRGHNEKWAYYRYNGTSLDDMKIGDLVELAKSGELDNGKFGSIYNDRVRRLEWNHAETIKRMLIENGYITRDDLPKGRN